MAGLISIVQSLGLNNFIIRDKHLTNGLAKTVSTVNAVVAFVLSLLIAAMGLAEQYVFREPAVGRVMYWLCSTPIIGAIGFLQLALLERKGDFRAVSLIKTCGTLVAVLVTVSCALAGQSYMSFVYGQITLAVATLALTRFFAPSAKSFTMRFERIREIRQFSFHVITTTGASRVASRVQEIALGRVLGLSSLGIYSRAGNIFSMLWDSIFLVVCRVAFVDFAAENRAERPLAGRYSYGLQLLTGLMWPAFAGLGVLSGPFVATVYGENWIAVETPLSLLCVVGILYTSIAMNWDLFLIANETGRQAKFEAWRSVITTIIFLMACHISLNVAVSVRIIDGLISFMFYMPHVVRISGITIGSLSQIYARSAFLAVVSIVPSLTIMVAYGWSPAASPQILMLAIALGVALWCFTLWGLKHPLFMEASKILRARNPKRLARLPLDSQVNDVSG